MVFILVLTVIVLFCVICLLRRPQVPILAYPSDPWKFADDLYVPLRADSREIFISDPLLSGGVYQVTITGTYRFWDCGVIRQQADAAYYTDATGNFAVP